MGIGCAMGLADISATEHHELGTVPQIPQALKLR
jgi:hypothetical protein